MGTKEKDVQFDQLGQFFTYAASHGGLGYVTGNKSAIDPKTFLVKDDLLAFLSQGNKANQDAWALLWKDCGRDDNKVWQAIEEAFLKASDSVFTHVQLLREGLTIKGHMFSLWNHPASRTSPHSKQHDFSNNVLRITQEMTIPWNFAAKIGSNRRVDTVFHVNGIYYAFAEVKARQTGQSAAGEGRNKIAGDFREFAFGALLQARDKWQKEDSIPWPGFGAAKFPDTWKRYIYSLMRPHTKASVLLAVDMSEVWLAPSPDLWLAMCDEAIDQGVADPYGSPGLTEDMRLSFSMMPLIAHMERFTQVKAHLAGMLSGCGIAREINLFHYPRTDKTTQQKDFLRPRAPQRVVLERVATRVEELYKNEMDPKFIENNIRQKVLEALPNLGTEELQHIVDQRLKYKNGQDAYSILIQGAAGLGKTNLAVWIALELFALQEPLAPHAHPDTPRGALFDRCVILTDRVELRDNVAQEAERTLGTKGQVLLVETKEVLVKALTGQPLPANVAQSNILVVNLQKFPSIMNDIKKGDLSVYHKTGRTAFIIDEVHRSQNGSLNESATQVFVETLSEVASSTQSKKNIIIGLTATPSDTILARFGEWHRKAVMSDSINWIPYFSYDLNHAIKDGYVLNPTLGVVRLSVTLDFNKALTMLKTTSQTTSVKLTSENIYEHEGRQKAIAKRFSEMFVKSTMQALPHKNRAVLVGQGKAMVTVPSVKAAISMYQHIKDALLELANNSKGQMWEKYGHIVKDVAENRVFILYADKPSGQGESIPYCGHLNPKINGVQRSEKDIISGFRCTQAGSLNQARNSIIVVVDKLLTGFDEPTLHTLLIDRSMEGIGLFQTMCRPNRKIRGKTNMIVIDSCHDDTIAKEFPRVFRKYGGLATSDLDGEDLMQRVQTKRKEILQTKELGQLFKDWSKSATKPAERKLVVEALSDFVDMMLCKRAEEAHTLRRTIGGYLAAQRLAYTLMQLDPIDINTHWIEFLKETHMLLRVGNQDHGQAVEIAFEVEKIGFDDANRFEQEAKEQHRETKEKTKRLIDHLLREEESIHDQLENTIERLQEREETKRKRSEEIKGFLDTLFAHIDQASINLNEDDFRRSILDGSIMEKDHSERLHSFAELLGRAGDIAFRRGNRSLLMMVSRYQDLMFLEYREWVVSYASR